MRRYFYERKNKRILGDAYEKILEHFTSGKFTDTLKQLLMDATDFINCYPDQPYAYVRDEYAKYVYTHFKSTFFYNNIQFTFKHEVNEKPYAHTGYGLYFVYKNKERLLLTWEYNIDKEVCEKYHSKCIAEGYNPGGWLASCNR